MKFVMSHNNINVTDLNRSMAFYKKALNLEEVREKRAEDGSYVIKFLTDGESRHELELTWASGSPSGI